jgi:PAS domain S-box-containing protein
MTDKTIDEHLKKEAYNLKSELDTDSEKIKRLEEALEDVQNKFREAESIANFGFWELDPVTLNPTWTDGVFMIVGYDPEYGQVSYYDQKKFIHPDDWDSFYNALQIVLKTRKDVEMDIRIIIPDGSIRIFHIIAKPKKDKDNNLIGIRGTAQDITDLKILKNKLNESEIFYRTLFENTGTATIILDEALNIEMCNTQFEQLTGYCKEELGSRYCWEDIVLEEYHDIMIGYHELRKDGSELPPESYEIELIDKNNDIKIILINATLIPGTKKSVISLVDLTERKKIERELADSERRYRYMVENATAGMFILDKNDTIKYLNNHMAYILGYSVYEMLDKNIIGFLDDKEDFPINKNLVESKILQYNRFRFLDKERNVFWTNLTISPIFDSKNEYNGLLGIVTDTNMDKGVEEAFLEREEMFTDIIYDMIEMLNNVADDKIKSDYNKNNLSSSNDSDNN